MRVDLDLRSSNVFRALRSAEHLRGKVEGNPEFESRPTAATTRRLLHYAAPAIRSEIDCRMQVGAGGRFESESTADLLGIRNGRDCISRMRQADAQSILGRVP
jgi:hypothetical protein